MEITVLRGSSSVSSLSGGSLVWSRKIVARSLCRTLSFGVYESKVQRNPCLFPKRPCTGSGPFPIQSCKSEGVTNEMAVLMRSAGFDSFRCQHYNQRLDKSQELSFCLHIGRTVAGLLHSRCSGPVLFSLAARFHTAAIQEGRYICETDGRKGDVEQGESVGSSNECVNKVSQTEGEIEIELARVVASSKCAGVGSEDAGESKIDYWVVNFYHFIRIDDPHLEVARHTEFLKNHDVRGRIYISKQGINAQLSSRGKAAIDYAEWIKEDPRFLDLLVQTSPSPEGHGFPRLRLRYKPSLVQVEGGTQHLPVTDPTARAVPLSPAEWTEMMNEARLVGRTEYVALKGDSNIDPEQSDEVNLSSSSARQVILLDVRNGYEWDVGHFKGAQRPIVDCFKSTAFGLAQEEDGSDDPLANVDKEKVDVMMYCTGGIRCDVYSTILRAQGFKNLYSLKGGVSNYLKEEGAKKWTGNLFVFDSRLAVPPEVYHSKTIQEGGMSEDTAHENSDSNTEEAFASCRLCGDNISNPRHRNCANLDCNQLHLSCDECLPQYKGCCSQECSLAPKLRPLISSQQYERWHRYRPTEPTQPKPADYVSRRALKRRRRKERRKHLMMGAASENEGFEQLVS